jgi:hypothetical protein
MTWESAFGLIIVFANLILDFLDKNQRLYLH